MARNIENDRERKLVLSLLSFLHQHSFVIVVCKLYYPIHIYACQQISLGYIQKAAVHPQSPMNNEYIKANSWHSDMI